MTVGAYPHAIYMRGDRYVGRLATNAIHPTELIFGLCLAILDICKIKYASVQPIPHVSCNHYVSIVASDLEFNRHRSNLDQGSGNYMPPRLPGYSREG